MRVVVDAARPSVARVFCADTGASGTGFCVTEDGHIVTCNHVVADLAFPSGVLSVSYSSDIRVTLDGVTYGADLVTDPNDVEAVVYDYAVLQLRGASGVKAMPTMTLDDVEPGDDVLCLGYPLEFTDMVATKGIVSALITRPSHINTVVVMDTILTDALIQFGNSGGPMIHVPTGNAIGINTLKHSTGEAGTVSRWVHDPGVTAVPGLLDLMNFALRYAHVGLNYAVAMRHVQASSAWPAIPGSN